MANNCCPKNMKKIFNLLLMVVLLSSCGNDTKPVAEFVEGEAGVFYGGVFKVNETVGFRSLFPFSISTVSADHIAKQVYEGLIKQSQQDLTIEPSLAKRLDFNRDATVWTFYLNEGVKFHDDDCFEGGKGREVVAQDFKDCFDRLCEANADNHYFGSTFKGRVKGADAYHLSTINGNPLPGGVSGIEVVDKYTLRISLINPFAGFLNVLSTPGCWVYPKEAYEKYGSEMSKKCVGTGPFKLKSVTEEAVVLERNKNYWGQDLYGNPLPYLDGIKYSFVKEKKVEFLQFKEGTLDMIYMLPVDMITDILGGFDEAKEVNKEFDMQVVPAMSTFFLGFQHDSGLFKDKNLRLAFTHAINKEKLVDNVLDGEGIPANYGIVPPAFKGYKNKKLVGKEYNVELAKEYLAKAGYENGKGFPELELQISSEASFRDKSICEAIQSMLKKNLNVDIGIIVVPAAEHYELIESGKAQLWQSEWVASYPDPEAFLTIFSSDHIPEGVLDKPYLNSMRYKSVVFDSAFDASMQELNRRQRMKYYLKADQIAIDDAAVLSIFYGENYRLLKPYVTNFPANAMEYRDMSRVYMDMANHNEAKEN